MVAKHCWKRTFQAASFAPGNCYTLQLVSEKKEVMQMNNFMTLNHTHTAWISNYFKWEFQKDPLVKWVKSPKQLPTRTKRFGWKCPVEMGPGRTRFWDSQDLDSRAHPPMGRGHWPQDFIDNQICLVYRWKYRGQNPGVLPDALPTLVGVWSRLLPCERSPSGMENSQWWRNCSGLWG